MLEPLSTGAPTNRAAALLADTPSAAYFWKRRL
jgi:hypothetical protein